MDQLKNIKKDLNRLGLSENQAVIYLLLIQYKELRIQELVRLTKIPRSSIYDNLKILFELGLIEKIVDYNFSKIKPHPISLLRHKLDEQLQGLQDQMLDLDRLEKVLALSSKPSQATSVKYYKGVSGARQIFWNTLKTKDTLYVLSPWGRGRYVGIKFYKSFVAESKIRGFKEKVIINPTPRVLRSIKEHLGSSTSRTDVRDIRVLDEKDILIKGETLMYDNIYAQVYLHDEEITGFEIESKNFTNTQRSIFEILWNKAKPVSELL